MAVGDKETKVGDMSWDQQGARTVKRALVGKDREIYVQSNATSFCSFPISCLSKKTLCLTRGLRPSLHINTQLSGPSSNNDIMERVAICKRNK